MTSKSILQSKTFYLNVIAMICAFFPATNAWLAANPETAVSALTALNILMRLVTSGKVTIAGAGDNSSTSAPGMSPLWVIGAAIAGLGGTLVLQSCSSTAWQTIQSIPIRAGITGNYGTASYSSKSGVAVDVNANAIEHAVDGGSSK